MPICLNRDVRLWKTHRLLLRLTVTTGSIASKYRSRASCEFLTRMLHCWMMSLQRCLISINGKPTSFVEIEVGDSWNEWVDAIIVDPKLLRDWTNHIVELNGPASSTEEKELTAWLTLTSVFEWSASLEFDSRHRLAKAGRRSSGAEEAGLSSNSSESIEDLIGWWA